MRTRPGLDNTRSYLPLEVKEGEHVLINNETVVYFHQVSGRGCGKKSVRVFIQTKDRTVEIFHDRSARKKTASDGKEQA